MKRSEMITKLKNYLFGEDERPELFSRFSNEAFTDCADAILTFLESHGMQPPSYVNGYFTAPYLGCDSADVEWVEESINDWEPE